MDVSLSRDQFESHVERRSDGPPAVLYKYVTPRIASLVFRKRTVQWSSPIHFNDPFDAQVDLMWPLLTVEANRYQEDRLRRAIIDPSTWPPDCSPVFKDAINEERARIKELPEHQRESYIEILVRELKLEPETKAVRAASDDLTRRMRIFCMSSLWNSMLMWSHYADEHQGVVLGFDTDTLERNWLVPVERVRYSTDFPRVVDLREWIDHIMFGLGRPPTVADGGRDWALTKNVEWSYEEEWRFVASRPRGTIATKQVIEIPKGGLRRVIFGCNAQSGVIKRLAGLATRANPGVHLSKLNCHKTRFELVETQI